jgi:MFS family permease
MVEKRKFAIAGVLLAVFTNSLMYTVVFPMASRMVMYFGLVDNRSETGYYVGVIGGVMMVGRFLSSPVWGWLCDHWGRRPVIILGTITTTVLSVLFGLSTTYPWALAIRFFQGLLSPITLATRTIIAEMYPGKEQASAMSIFILIGHIGNVSGNILGGYFEEPSSLEIGLFTRFPFLLPNLILAVIGCLSLLLCLAFVTETLPIQQSVTESRGFCALLRDTDAAITILLVAFTSFNSTGVYEVLLLWLWANKSDGGFAMSPFDIGTVSAITSFALLLYMR